MCLEKPEVGVAGRNRAQLRRVVQVPPACRSRCACPDKWDDGQRGHFWERRYHAVAVPDCNTGHALRVLRYIHANPRAAGMIVGDEYAYSNYRSYARPADDGLSAWHPAYLRLGRTLDGCARRYERFCRRYRPEAKEQRRSRWGGWHLWREIEGGEATGQGDLFGASGASYRGGGRGRKRVGPVAVLRPGVLAAVERFIVTNQSSGGRHGDRG